MKKHPIQSIETAATLWELIRLLFTGPVEPPVMYWHPDYRECWYCEGPNGRDSWPIEWQWAVCQWCER